MIDFSTAKLPKITKIIEKNNENDHIETVKLRYSSVKGNEIYAVLSYPRKKGIYPCILVLHGGTQNAEIVKNRVEQNAKNGYISIAPELPVIADPTENSVGEWTERGYMSGAFENDEDPYKSSLFEAVTAAAEAFLLAENINPFLPQGIELKEKSLGLTGFSWGGYMVTMLCGIFGKRVTAGFSNYGCGYYDLSYFWSKYFEKMSEKSKEIWLENYDAGRKAKNIVSPYFIASPSNDLFFNPPSVMKTLEAVKTAEKGVVFSPNSHHCIEVPGGTSKDPDAPHGCAMEKIYFDYYLKNEGDGFFKVTRKGNSITTNAKNPEISVFYSESDALWTERKWKKLGDDGIIFDGKAYSVKACDDMRKNCDFYFLVTDERNVSVSSDIFKF